MIKAKLINTINIFCDKGIFIELLKTLAIFDVMFEQWDSCLVGLRELQRSYIHDSIVLVSLVI